MKFINYEMSLVGGEGTVKSLKLVGDKRIDTIQELYLFGYLRGKYWSSLSFF